MHGLSILEPCIVALLVGAAWTDIAHRLIPNWLCLSIAVAGAILRLAVGPTELLEALAFGMSVLFLLWPLFDRNMIGGGDLKLLAAIAIGLPLPGIVQMFAITALAGGVLVLVHLAMRRLPPPRLAHSQAGILRRVYAVERWRILRHAPLPYGVAIACGGTWALLSNIGV